MARSLMVLWVLKHDQSPKMHFNAYLSKYGHILKIRTSGCSNSMGKYVNTLLVYHIFMGDMWILTDYLDLW